jgi:ubiquitin-like 1-activating enzyme E1 B
MDVVDLDTIDVSNLNRQFLFRPHHVGSSKAAIASAAVSSLNPDCKITAIHGNVIKGREFTADYFASFDLVINALDNQAARSHVNRMCLATRRPLVEGGSTGFMGQAHTIIGGTTMCYDCEPKPVQKTYPVCTIRRYAACSTPSLTC